MDDLSFCNILMSDDEVESRFKKSFSDSLLFRVPFDKKGQEKWSSVRITDPKKNTIKVENHISVHSNLNLNGLCPETTAGNKPGIGKEVKCAEVELALLWRSRCCCLFYCLVTKATQNLLIQFSAIKLISH